ncbi:MAG: radical SAM protein [Desulfomonilia bacterium]
MNDPSYRALYKTGTLENRIHQALDLLSDCRLCPRECGVDRTSGETGFCSTGRYARVASFGQHFGEESPLVGRNGSGTIFFSSCNLLCTFCQNFDISHQASGEEVGPRELASMMISLSESGCHNINFVTPSHVVPQILEALPAAIEGGVRVPLVFNTGTYDHVSTLQLLDGIFDVYMPDFKFWDESYAQKFCSASDYRDVARNAIREMHRQVGDLQMDEDGIALRGLLVRHLVMPGGIAGTEQIMHFLAEEISKHTYVNVMDQYHPCYRAHDDALIDRRITREEYMSAVESARNAGLTRLDRRTSFRIQLF